MLNKFQLGYSKNKFANIILLLIIVLGIVVSVAPLSAVFASESLADSQNSEQNSAFTYTQSDENVSDAPFMSDTSTSTVRGITMTFSYDVYKTEYKGGQNTPIFKVVGRITIDKKFKKRHSDALYFPGANSVQKVYLNKVETQLVRQCIIYDAKGNPTHYPTTNLEYYRFPSINPNETLIVENFLRLHSTYVPIQLQYLNLSKRRDYLTSSLNTWSQYNSYVCFDSYVSNRLIVYKDDA